MSCVKKIFIGVLLPVISFCISSYVMAESLSGIYQGHIGKKLSVTMILEQNKEALIGKYFYEGKFKYLSLEGKVKEGDTFKLNESVQYLVEDHWEEKLSGNFEGSFKEGELKGIWTSADKKKSFPFHLKPLKTTLKGLSGEYKCQFSEGKYYNGFLEMKIEPHQVKHFIMGSVASPNYHTCRVNLAEDFEDKPEPVEWVNGGFNLSCPDEAEGSLMLRNLPDQLWVIVKKCHPCGVQGYLKDFLLDKKSHVCRAINES
ncbi:MAG: hypothetical protein KDK66_02010 [Deltaproteobacteria bacterium]|nr:hypothetical protein [Deltaproteobacteria bacterium]